MTTTPARLPDAQRALVAVLLAVGCGFLALAGYRALRPAARPPERDLAREAEADLEKRGYRPLSEPLEKLVADPDYLPVPTQAPPLLGQQAPDFTLEAVSGETWSLAQAREKGSVVLVFYYGYNCNHCVSQLFGLHKDIDKFAELGATVVAVSADTPELTRQRFKKYGPFAFPVLSDPGNAVAQRYGVYRPKPRSDEGDLMHGTFVIARDGRVTWVNSGDEPFTEDQTLLVEVAKAERRRK